MPAEGQYHTLGTDFAQLPLGNDGDVMTADSSKPENVRWASPATPAHLVYDANGNLIGLQLTSPDGTASRTLGIDDNGAITLT